MNKDTSGGVGRPETAPGRRWLRDHPGLAGAGPDPQPEAGRAANLQVSRVRTRRHRGPSRHPADSGGKIRSDTPRPGGGSLQAGVI